MLSIKQGGIKYHFFKVFMIRPGIFMIRPPVTQTIDEHSTKEPVLGTSNSKCKITPPNLYYNKTWIKDTIIINIFGQFKRRNIFKNLLMIKKNILSIKIMKTKFDFIENS